MDDIYFLVGCKMLDVILLIALTVFIFSRLFKVLGDTKFDNENPGTKEQKYWDVGQNPSNQKQAQVTQKIEIASALEAELDEKDREVFELIRKKYDPLLTADKFLQGAKNAFEMIVKNFNEGNKGVLKELLATDLQSTFEDEIDKRLNSNQKYEVTLVSIKDTKIIGTTNLNDYITIKIKFITEQIIVIRDLKSTMIIDGNAKKIKVLSDTWTFGKDMKSKSKVWKLVAVHDD